MSNKAIIGKIHLVISVLIVIPVAIVYGFNPSLEFDINPETLDEWNFMKGIMGLYLGCSTLWILGIFKKKFYMAALLSNLVFMLSMGLGRLLSIALDGIPSNAYLYGTLAELFLGFYGLWLVKRVYGGDWKNSNTLK